MSDFNDLGMNLCNPSQQKTRMKAFACRCSAWSTVLALAWGAAAAAEVLELDHADFHARLGIKVYAHIGGNAPDATLKAVLTCDQGRLSKTVAEKKGLKALEVVTLDLRELPAGKYTLMITLSDGRTAVRTWEKPYGGIPRVGIDENNALCIQGNPFFPVTPCFVGSEEEMRKWSPYVNAFNGVGFVVSRYNIDGCREFLDLCAKHGKPAIAPGRGDYWPNHTNTGTCYYTDRNHGKAKDRAADHEAMTGYVKALKDHPALLMWHWKDEPDIDYPNHIPPTEVRQWAEICHRYDPHHPVIMNLSGMPFGRPSRNWSYKHIQTYTYDYHDIPGLQKVLLADILSQDYYPIENQNDKFFEVSIENLCLAMDRMRDWNRGLAPLMACVETCDMRKPDIGPPTPAELRLLCWINIIHGARGIIWFHYFNPTPKENFAEMARFLQQVSRLTPAVCGPVYAGAITKQEAGGGRIDLMATVSAGQIYLFAANLKRKPEKVTFKLDFSPKTIEVVDENRRVTANGRVFTDDFASLAVHIYRISK